LQKNLGATIPLTTNENTVSNEATNGKGTDAAIEASWYSRHAELCEAVVAAGVYCQQTLRG